MTPSELDEISKEVQISSESMDKLAALPEHLPYEPLGIKRHWPSGFVDGEQVWNIGELNGEIVKKRML